MKRITYIAYYLFLCVSLAFLYACQDEHDGALPGTGASVRVAFQLPDYVNVGTRLTSESAIKDVTVLQFIEGRLVNKQVLEDQLFSQAVDLSGLGSMSAASLDENGKLLLNQNENVIVFLANFNQCFPEYVSALTEGTTTYTQLLAKTATLTDADQLAGFEYMPMTGFYYGGIIEFITNQINVTLTRSLAKINFTLNASNFYYENKPVSSIIINKIELCNVPKTVTVFPPANRPALPVNDRPGEWPEAQMPYPVATGGNYGSPDVDNTDPGTDADNFMTLGVAHNQATAVSTNFLAYMPENARGSYAANVIASNKDKHPYAISGENPPSGWTYIYVDLDFTTSDDIIKKATYKIFLGGDDKGDINILAGTQYSVTTFLYGANTADTRIKVSSIFDPTVTNAKDLEVYIPGMANSYIINPESNYQVTLADSSMETLNNIYSAGNFILPLLQARNGWRYIQAATSDGDYVAQFDALIKSNNWEIVTLWKTYSGNDKNVGFDKATGVQTGNGNADGYYVKLTGLNDLTPGHNYVIALRQTAPVDGVTGSNGTIWWTWHLWVTDYNPDWKDGGGGAMKGQTHSYFGDAFTKASGIYHGKKIMDRNLGATATGVTGSIDPTTFRTTPTNLNADTYAPNYYGLIYQWGRKDPFTASDNGANTMTAAEGILPIYDAKGYLLSSTSTTANNDNDGFPKVAAGSESNLINAVRNPRNYYTGTDWTTRNDGLWNTTTKTAFDPCPPGWRVSAGGTDAGFNPWAGFNGNGSSNTANTSGLGVNDPAVFKWYDNNGSQTIGGGARAGRLYDASVTGDNSDTTKAWYPASGLREPTSGAFIVTGSWGYAWSCAVSGANAYFIEFSSSVVRPSYSLNRARGCPVRCVQN